MLFYDFLYLVILSYSFEGIFLSAAKWQYIKIGLLAKSDMSWILTLKNIYCLCKINKLITCIIKANTSRTQFLSYLTHVARIVLTVMVPPLYSFCFSGVCWVCEQVTHSCNYFHWVSTCSYYDNFKFYIKPSCKIILLFFILVHLWLLIINSPLWPLSSIKHFLLTQSFGTLREAKQKKRLHFINNITGSKGFN